MSKENLVNNNFNSASTGTMSFTGEATVVGKIGRIQPAKYSVLANLAG